MLLNTLSSMHPLRCVLDEGLDQASAGHGHTATCGGWLELVNGVRQQVWHGHETATFCCLCMSELLLDGASSSMSRRLAAM